MYLYKQQLMKTPERSMSIAFLENEAKWLQIYTESDLCDNGD